MKKRFIAIAALTLIAVFALAACGSNNLVGRWTDNDGLTFEFHSGGNLTMTEEWMGQTYTETGRWSTSGSRLTMTIEGDTETATFNVSGSTLTLTWSDGWVETFTRLP